MAKKKTDEKPERSLPDGARVFSGKKFTEFVEGEEITGTFISMEEIEIKDRKPPYEMKTIRVYNLKLDDGSKARISGRALLDSAFEEIAEELGGISKLSGMRLSLIRGEDIENTEGNNMGTYEIIVY